MAARREEEDLDSRCEVPHALCPAILAPNCPFFIKQQHKASPNLHLCRFTPHESGVKLAFDKCVCFSRLHLRLQSVSATDSAVGTREILPCFPSTRWASRSCQVPQPHSTSATRAFFYRSEPEFSTHLEPPTCFSCLHISSFTRLSLTYFSDTGIVPWVL